MSTITLGSSTDLGKRESNEDSALAVVSQSPGASTDSSSSEDGCTSALLILADGMGGRAKGEIASRTAIRTVYRELAHILAMRAHIDRDYLENSLHNALRAANTRIKDLGEDHPETGGMGTTCTVGVIVGGLLSLAHVGDSRAYLVRPNQKIEALTEDHSVVAGEVRAGRLTEDEARKSKFRNVITRAVGVDADVVVDVQSFSLIPGELAQVVITTDGLHGAVTEERIDEIVRASKSPQAAAEQLVAEAKANGAKDNISVILAKIDPGADKAPDSPRARQRRKAKMPGNILAFALGVLLTGLIAWIALPGLLSPKTLLKTPMMPIVPKTVVVPDLKGVTYAAPQPLIGRKVLDTVLLRSGDNMIVVDPAEARVLQVEPGGKVLTSVSDIAKLANMSAHDTYWASDVQGNLYQSIPDDKFIRKFDSDGKFLRTVGQGVLTHPEAITVVSSGDLYVIDQGTLELLKALPPAQNSPVNAVNQQPKQRGTSPTVHSGT